VAALALAIAATLAACGGCDDSDRTARACAGASSGDAALHGPGSDIEARVRDAEDAAADAARALPSGDRDDPADVDAQAVDALLKQSLRLRLVRSQIQREERAPQEVLDAAAAGLTAGDRIVRDRLAAAGVTC
jgi:hypothetical protein